MSKNKPYKKDPAHFKKLGALKKEETEAMTLMITCLANGNLNEAKAARILWQQAHGRLEAFMETMVGWHESGVPTSGYAV